MNNCKLYLNSRFTSKIVVILLGCFVNGTIYGQDNFTVYYNGISKSDKSPHVENKTGDVGIKNPERGFSIRAGVIDFNSTSDYPSQNYFENISSSYPSDQIPLSFYLDNFEDDGISLVETEVYVNYKDTAVSNSTTLSQSDLEKPSIEILPNFHENGLKAHLILNSSFTYLQKDVINGLGICEENDERFNKNLGYLDALMPFFEDINPYTAVVHLGWISNPWLVDEYRLSSHWKRTNFGYFNSYPTGNVIKDVDYQNYHNTFRESTQRSSWGQIGDKASVWNYPSGINKLKKQVIDKTLESFSGKKILLKSTMAIGNYIGTTLNSIQPSSPFDLSNGSINLIDKTLKGVYDLTILDEDISHLKDEDGFLRFGYYDHAFGAETYDHYWTIGNSSSQNIQWNSSQPSALGNFWGGSQYFTDVHNLRKYRTSLWNHGEMPVYETEDTTINLNRNPGAWSTSSFNMNYSYFENWYQFPFNEGPGYQNKQFDYEIAEGISSGRLQDGFFSALKLRYFNYTSFNITHNNELDGRSPYEMKDGFTIHPDGLVSTALEGSGIPNKENTAIQGWKNKSISQVELEDFGMPISNRYFKDDNGNSVNRTAYEYIRDHLGYRLELQSTKFKKESDNLIFQLKIINRGFTVPQNKRHTYFVLLNSSNEIINSVETNYDWRKWEPDGFAVSNDGLNNLVSHPQGSTTLPLDDIVIGGIPLGSQNSDWFRSPIDSNYQPYEHNLYGSFNLAGLPDGKYKVGIVLPDMDKKLYDNSDFSVKFANQVKYLECQGITILGSVVKGGVGDLDSDEDGVINSLDANPYNPIEIANTGILSEATPCQLAEHLSTNEYHPEISSDQDILFINSDKSLLIQNYVSDIKIFDVQGKLIVQQLEPSSNIDLSLLKNGVYLIQYSNGFKTKTIKIVK